MGGVGKSEDLVAWQKSRELTKAIYEVTRDGALARDFGLADQMRRASVSIMSNVAEGFARAGEREFRRYLTMAHASSAELRSQLYVARDVGYLDRESFEALVGRAEEVGRVIAGLRSSLGRKRWCGGSEEAEEHAASA